MRPLIALLFTLIQVAQAADMPHPTNDHPTNPVGLASQVDNCQAKNLSTNPIGPITYYEAEYQRDHTAFTIWRMPCQDGSHMPVMTIEPISHKPFVCSFNFEITQNGAVFDDVLLLKNPNTKWSFLCGDIKRITTVRIHQLEKPYFDADDAFTITHKRPYQEAITVTVPALHQPSPNAISGHHSGNYISDDDNQQEIVIQVTEDDGDKTVSVYWMHSHLTAPTVFKGITTISDDAETVALDMYDLWEVDPIAPWGHINLEWLTCEELVVELEPASNQAPSVVLLTKQSSDIDGLSCE